MMNNYPAGVTGNELQIAGPDWEGQVDTGCPAKNVTLKVLIDTTTGQTVDVNMNECPYNGAADAWSYQGVLHWTCPACGTEHHEEV